MDTELIIKLIRLANGNNNEHEANSAARRACKLLDGYTFNGTSSNQSNQSNQTSYDSTTDFWTILRREQERAYNQQAARDASERDLRERSAREYERVRRENAEADSRRAREQEKRKQEANPFNTPNFHGYNGPDYNRPFTGDRWADSQPTPNPEDMSRKEMTCIRCGAKRMTRYKSSATFKCSECRWREYNKSTSRGDKY